MDLAKVSFVFVHQNEKITKYFPNPLNIKIFVIVIVLYWR